MKKRTLVFINIIAPYNIPLFNKVCTGLNNNIYFFFDQAKEINRNWAIDKAGLNFKYQVENSLSINITSKLNNDTSILKTIYFPFYIFKKIFKFRPAIVVSIEFGLRTIFSLLMCKIVGSKFVVMSDVTTTTESTIGGLKKFIRKSIAKLSDGAIARSYNAKCYLLSLGFEECNIVVAPYAVEFQLCDKNNSENEFQMLLNKLKEKIGDKFCFFYSGQFIHRKGLDILSRIVNDMPDVVKDKVIFILAGGTEGDLQKLLVNYDRKRFYPVGFIPNNELIHLYRLAHCFILPTRFDTWAVVVNEAVVSGCPVLVSKYAGSADELIEDGKTGFVFDPLDEQQFKEKLINCINNKDQLVLFSKMAKKKLVEYNNEVAANRIVELLKKWL